MSHITHMNKSCHTYEWVKSRWAHSACVHARSYTCSHVKDHTPVPMWKIIHLFPCERSYTCSHVKDHTPVPMWEWAFPHEHTSRETIHTSLWSHVSCSSFSHGKTHSYWMTSAFSHGRPYLTWERSPHTSREIRVRPPHSHMGGLTSRESIHTSLWSHLRCSHVKMSILTREVLPYERLFISHSESIHVGWLWLVGSWKT